MSTTATTDTYWSRSRDKYGRSCHHLYELPRHRCHGVAVRMPAGWVEARSDGMKYLANDWQQTEQSVTYHATLSSAKRHLITKAGL